MRTPNNEGLSSDIVETANPRRDGGGERRCILTGQHGSRETLIRLAIGPGGEVLPDPLARAPGRGAWLAVDRPTLEAAMGSAAEGAPETASEKAGNKGRNKGGRLRGALARAFKGAPLSVPSDLPQLIDNALRRVFLDRLGLEMRAGHLILGSDRIAEHARGGVVELLLHAADASQDGRRKLDQAWRVGRGAEGSGEQGIALPLDRQALSVALGRDNVVHLALTERRAAERVGLALERMLHFTGARKGATDSAGQTGADSG